jgi:hypothetical protein
MSEEQIIQTQESQLQTQAPQQSQQSQQPQPSISADTTKPWYDGISEDDVTYLKAKGLAVDGGYKNLISSYKNLEKMRGVPEDKLLRLPDPDDKESWDKLYNKIGRPESPEGYDWKQPEGANVNEELVNWFHGKAHELGLNKQQHNELISKFLERNQEILGQYEKTLEMKKEQEFKQLEKEWGGAYDERMHLAKIGLRQFVGDEETPEAIEIIQNMAGHAAVAKFFAKIGEKSSESKMAIAEGNRPFGQGPAQAQEEIKVLLSKVRSDQKRLEAFTKGQGYDREVYKQLMEVAYGKQQG